MSVFHITLNTDAVTDTSLTGNLPAAVTDPGLTGNVSAAASPRRQNRFTFSPATSTDNLSIATSPTNLIRTITSISRLNYTEQKTDF